VGFWDSKLIACALPGFSCALVSAIDKHLAHVGWEFAVQSFVDEYGVIALMCCL